MWYGTVTIYDLQHLSDTEIVFPELIKCDIPPIQGGFGQVIDQLFLPQGQPVKACQTISEKLKISKPLTLIREIHEILITTLTSLNA